MHSQFIPVFETFKNTVNQLNQVAAKLHHPEITKLTTEANTIQERISEVVQQSPSDSLHLKEEMAQSNLLALNLAIEATKLGGETGQSIAHIAESFRKMSIELRKWIVMDEHPGVSSSAHTNSADAGQNWLKRLFKF